ncbi:MAG: hypothetical protein C0442_06765 [Chlorobiaceae bacterium]|nr:hypothetical protein [Chlorobiaceae bacterium]
MQNILFYSPDLNLCASMLMYFSDKYSVTTTTDFDSLFTYSSSGKFDLVIIDSEPTSKIEIYCKELEGLSPATKILLLYVYTPKFADNETKIKSLVDGIFYKPLNLDDVTNKIHQLLYAN